MRNNRQSKKEMKAIIRRYGIETVARKLDISERYVKMIEAGLAPGKRLYRDIQLLSVQL